MDSQHSMIRKLFSLFVMCVVFTAHAQNVKQPFSEETAKAFVESAKDLELESKNFKQKALTSYAKSDILNAAEELRVSKMLAIFSAEGSKLPNALKAQFLSDKALRDEFLSILNPKDNLEKVLSILTSIWNHSQEDFKKFKSLAIAIAIVFDSPVPESWPHHQVSSEVLPRTLPDPLDAFKYWVQMRERGRLLMQPERLGAEELKFMVASVTTNEDKEWAQNSLQINVANLNKLYASIKYDYGRLNRSAYNWGYSDYALKTIKEKGGICTDQSYYTTEVAKARGVPAFICSGAGSDGFHAWAAVMERSGKWNMNIGRYENSRFVTGRTIDPQTWHYASDHSLKAMSEKFRNGKKYQANEIHTMFAKTFFEDGDYEKCVNACNLANKQDFRNADTWSVLIEAMGKTQAVETQIRNAYMSAIRSFAKYPDTDIVFRRALMKRLSDVGEDDEAEKLSSSIIIKTKGSRPDIAMNFARSELERKIAKDEIDKFYTSYKRLLGMFKNDGAMAFSGISIPIINALLKEDKKTEAKEVASITRAVMKPAKNSTLNANLTSVEKQLSQM